MGSGSEAKARLYERRRDPSEPARSLLGGLTGWLVERIARLTRSRTRRAAPRLALVERIALAPRQSLARVAAEGRRILVATSAEGASAFFPLDDGAQPTARNRRDQNRAESAVQSASDCESKPVAIHAQRVSVPRISW